MRNILIESLRNKPVSQWQVEIVERKGKGHPDSICDAIMEEVSRALSREYQRRFGRIFHYNVDKGLLVAGEVERKLGGGRIVKPMRIIFGDRATEKVDSQVVPVQDIAVAAAKEWIKNNLRFVDPDTAVEYQNEIHAGSTALAAIFREPRELLGANDTSAAVGYAPMTETESLVLEMERHLNSETFKKIHPETGEDVKVMGFRGRKKLFLTVAMPFIDRYIDSEAGYYRKKKEVLQHMTEFANSKQGSLSRIVVDYNTLDREGEGMSGMYLTVLGTSAEDADSGQVGRGNRVNGVIALNRPASAEAAAGKNPVSHVGKIYNVLAHRIANEIYTGEGLEGKIREVYIWLCSEIGLPIDQPKIASAQLILERGVTIHSVANKVQEIIDFELTNIGEFVKDLEKGKYTLY